MSTVSTAQNIVISVAAGASTTVPAPEGFFLFSVDGGVTWISLLNIAALSPGAVSSLISIRRTIPVTALLSNWSPRISAVVGSWS